MTDYKDIKNQEIKPWWVEMPDQPTRFQLFAEILLIVSSSLAFATLILWLVL